MNNADSEESDGCKQIAKVALVVSDLNRSYRFYKEVLGLEEFHYDKLKPGTGATFHAGNGYIGLWLRGEWPNINLHDRTALRVVRQP